MKKIFILFTVAALTACGGANDTQKLLDTKKKELEEVNESIKADQEKKVLLEQSIDSLLALLDSGKTKEKSSLVSLKTLEQNAFRHVVEIQGLVTSDNNIMLSAENGGRVVKVHVKEGDQVRQGQLLIDLDGGVLESQLAELNTRLKLAESTYEKQKSLWAKKIGTKMQFEQAENNYQALLNQKNTLMQQVSKFHLKAPFSGTIDEVFVNMGEMTAPGSPAVRVVSLQDMEIAADVSENYVGKFNAGDKVKVVFPALGDTVETSILAVGQVINPNNRTFKMHVKLPNQDKKFKPNLLAVIHAVDFAKDEAISIPSKLVQTTAGEKFVMIAEHQDTAWRAVKRPIVTGPTSKGSIYIESGLKAGDVIITNGYLNIESGDLLNSLEESNPEK